MLSLQNFSKIAFLHSRKNLSRKKWQLNSYQFYSQFNTPSVNNASSALSVDNPDHFLKKKFNDLVIWYEQLTGMDEVRMMQNRVIEAQDRFATAQEKRRTMSQDLIRVQSKLKEIHSELDTTSRGEERYLQLITQEHAILKEERKLTSEFALVEREERDSFTNLSACVKESHEKERAQAERTKYWSIIGSILGTVIGIVGSSINNEFKMKELRKLVKDLTLHNSLASPDLTAANILAHHEEQLSSIVSEMKSTVHNYVAEKDQENVIGRIDKLLHTISHKQPDHNISDQSVQALEKKVEELKSMLNSAQRFEGQLVAIPNDLEALIHKQTRETRLVLIGVSVVGVVVPFLIAFLQK